jgi:acyl-[acyl carrier protein]--UDP-N-acetylglucosamine O-acyltransferase
MNKISDFNYLNEKIKFNYSDDIMFEAVGASEDNTNIPLLFYLTEIKYLKKLEEHSYNIAGIICPNHLQDKLTNYKTIICEEPKTLFFLIHNELPDEESIPTVIEENCKISEKSYISPYNVVIKSGTVIEEFVSIKSGTYIGKNCFIGAGSRIGTEGFNVFQLNNKNKLVKHRGHVIIKNEVVILTNACIAKSIYNHINTIIEDNAMLDNLVQVAHDAKIKRNAELASGTVLCGFSEVGEDTFMGVNSAIKQFKKVNKNNKVGMGASINFDTEKNEVIAGHEPMPLRDARLLKKYKKELINKLKEKE